MKIALIGSSGQLGAELCRVFENTGQLICIPRSELDLNWPQDMIISRLSSVDFDVAINCAALADTQIAEENPELAYRLNSHAVQSIGMAVARKQRWLIHVSTDYVFGEHAAAEPFPLVEETPKEPLNVYGASKSLGEDLVLQTTDRICILRVASLFGLSARSDRRKDNFIEKVLHLARSRATLTVVSDQIMSPTYAGDVADLIVKFIGAGLVRGIFHANNSGHASWFELARHILSVAGAINTDVLPIDAADYASKVRRPHYSALDNGKLASILGPIPVWQDALQRYIMSRNEGLSYV